MHAHLQFFFAFLLSCLILIACKGDKQQSQNQNQETSTSPDEQTIETKVLSDAIPRNKEEIPVTSTELENAAAPTKETQNSGPKSEPTQKPKAVQEIPKKSIEYPQTVKDKVKTKEDIPAAEKPRIEEEVPSTIIKETVKPVVEKEVVVEEQPVVEEEVDEKEVKKEDVANALSHAAFNTLLSKYVSSQGKVNYKGLVKDKAALVAYTEELKSNYPDQTWSRDARLAYLINAYNAFTLLLIVENYPLKSIMDLDGGKVWDRVWINLGVRKLSLNHIELGMLLKEMKEPRVHFAVNCAAKSCPPLHNEAFTEKNVQSLLESRTRAFINDKTQNTFSGKHAELSKIFEWYKHDFYPIIDFINRYISAELPKDAELTYKEYDWNLNE